MASLRNEVRRYAEELRGCIAEVVFYKEGRSWSGWKFYLDAHDRIQRDDLPELRRIVEIDPRALVVDYYNSAIFESDGIEWMTDRVRYLYESQMGEGILAGMLQADAEKGDPEISEKEKSVKRVSDFLKSFGKKTFTEEQAKDAGLSDLDIDCGILAGLIRQNTARSDYHGKIVDIRFLNYQTATVYEDGYEKWRRIG